MKLRTKILLTVFLAVLVVLLFGCGGSKEHYVSTPSVANGEVDLSYLKAIYASFNDGYFHNKLTKTPKIDMLLTQEGFMGNTMCHEDGSCTIQFNPKYTLASRHASLVMLHEMCHIETWSTDVVKFGGTTEQADHGKVWRSCMLRLDSEGVFREIIIDNYANEMP